MQSSPVNRVRLSDIRCSCCSRLAPRRAARITPALSATAKDTTGSWPGPLAVLLTLHLYSDGPTALLVNE